MLPKLFKGIRRWWINRQIDKGAERWGKEIVKEHGGVPVNKYQSVEDMHAQLDEIEESLRKSGGSGDR